MSGRNRDYVKWIREKVGHCKIFLVFATIVLRDKAGAVLLQYRNDFEFWGLPGGALEIEEDILSCARRELREETGLEAQALRVVGVYTDPRYDVIYPNGDEVQQFTVCFAGRLSGGQPQVDGVEIRKQQFFMPAEISWNQLPVWYRHMLRDALAGGPARFCPPYRGTRTKNQIVQIRQYIGHDMCIGVGAKAVVFRDDGHVLLVRRRDNEAWAFPAGFSDIGENVAYTALREVQEETGFVTVPERIIGIYSATNLHHTYGNGDRIKNVGVLFKMRLLGGKAEIDEREVSEMAWVPPEAVMRYQGQSPFRPLYERAIAHANEGTFAY